MERLNEIVSRTVQQRRPQHNKQRFQQEASPGQPAAGQQPLRRLQAEQLSRPGRQPRQPAYPSQMQQSAPAPASGPRNRSMQGAQTREQSLAMPPLPSRSAPAHPQRYLAANRSGEPDFYQDGPQERGLTHQPARLGQRSAPGVPYQQTGNAPLPTRSVPLDQGNAHRPLVQADVIEEWNEDTAHMRYGDWESEGGEEQISERGYPAAPTRAAQLPPSNSSFTTRKLPIGPSVESTGEHSRQLRDARLPMAQPPTAQAMRPYQRVTQPLNVSTTVASLNTSLPQSQYQQPQVPRRIVGEEQVTVYTPPTPRIICPKCDGAGYLRSDVPYGHPNFGKPIACECKEAEQKEKRRQQLRSMSNLDAFHKKSFRNFHSQLPGIQQAFQAAWEYAQSPDGWLLLVGPNGCGKTHLAAAIANSSLEDGSLVLFATVPDLLDHLRAAFAPSASEVFDQLFAKMREAELLVLDDFGAQQSSPWANEKLFQLLNYRYDSRFPTVITANRKGLEGIDERIRSRMTDVSLVHILTFDGAMDYRPRNPRKE